MFSRKFLAISIGIAITIAGAAPACYAKKGTGSSHASSAKASTEGGADANSAVDVTASTGGETGADEDLAEVASVIANSDKLVSAGKFPAAIEVLRAGLKEHGQNPHLHERLSKVFYMNGSIDDAISELLMAISIDPNVFDYYSDVAWLYSISGKYREAVTYSKQALSRDPNKAYPYVVMGFSLGCLGKKQQATEMLKRAIELDPNNPTAHLYLADVIAGGGDYEKALPMYQKSLKLDSSTASAFVGLGDCFRKLGHPKEAMAAYKRAVDLAPQDATARGHLGFALSQSGDYAGAMRQGMTANSIRLGQYWGKFMGMFVAVWAGIFLVFGTVFGAMFMGSRFNPVPGESILNQFVMVFYKERPGRFVITDKRLVFVPEIVSRWFGATRVSIQRDQISSVKTEGTASGGTVTISVGSESASLFRVPGIVYGPLVAVLSEQRLLGEVSEQYVTGDHGKKAPCPVPTTRMPEKEEQSDTAQFEQYAVIAASFDFRDGHSEEPTLKLSAIPEPTASQSSSTALFKGAPKPGDAAAKSSKKTTAPVNKDPKTDKPSDTKKDSRPLKPLAKLEPIPSAEPKEKSDSTPVANSDAKLGAKADQKADAKADSSVESKVDSKSLTKENLKADSNVDPKATPKPAPPDSKSESKTDSQ